MTFLWLLSIEMSEKFGSDIPHRIYNNGTPASPYLNKLKEHLP
jgi:hypothetical protein